VLTPNALATPPTSQHTHKHACPRADKLQVWTWDGRANCMHIKQMQAEAHFPTACKYKQMQAEAHFASVWRLA